MVECQKNLSSAINFVHLLKILKIFGNRFYHHIVFMKTMDENIYFIPITFAILTKGRRNVEGKCKSLIDEVFVYLKPIEQQRESTCMVADYVLSRTMVKLKV